jgi:hypothetical protein
MDQSRGAGQGMRSNKTNGPVCSYCRKPNHTEDICYSKHGYPAGHPRHAVSNASSNNNGRAAHTSLASTLYGAVADEVAAAPAPTPIATTASTAHIQQPPRPATNSRSEPVECCEWLIDSGASQHLCNTRAWFADLEPVTGIKVQLGDNRFISATGRGHINVDIPINGRLEPAVFSDVLYVPDIAANLLSVSKMTQSGLRLSFNKARCIIRSGTDGRELGRAVKHGNTSLYCLVVTPRQSPTHAIESTANTTAPIRALAKSSAIIHAAAAIGRPATNTIHPSLQLAHQRMGHLHLDALLRLLSDNMATDIDWTGSTANSGPAMRDLSHEQVAPRCNAQRCNATCYAVARAGPLGRVGTQQDGIAERRTVLRRLHRRLQSLHHRLRHRQQEHGARLLQGL